jgi:methionyl-tRNA formyltransferase
MMRIIFMGTPEFAVPALQALMESEHDIVAVYTAPDRPAGRGRRLSVPVVKSLALDCGLMVRQPRSLRGSAEVAALAELGPDLIVSAAYGLILPRQVLQLPTFGCINIHPSLLPRHRGPSPVVGAILAGDEETGVTIILMDEGMDTGPILSMGRIPIEPQDTTASLTAKLADMAAVGLMDIIPLWCAGRIALQPQDETMATTTALVAKEDGAVDWQLSALELWRRVRAFNPWPWCYTYFQGRLLRTVEAAALPERESRHPGRVVALKEAEDVSVGVETGGGVLGLRRVQLEGRRVMLVEDFVRGQRDFVGATLPS